MRVKELIEELQSLNIPDCEVVIQKGNKFEKISGAEMIRNYIDSQFFEGEYLCRLD
jgi:hypothetical protein